MPSTYTLISSNVLSSSAASVTFSAIPSTYRDLVLRVSARCDEASIGTNIYALFNGQTIGTSGYSMTILEGDGSTPASGRNASYGATRLGSGSTGTSATASTFSNVEVYLPNYTVSQNKPISVFGVTENNATSARLAVTANLWNYTTTINQIQLLPNNLGNFVSGSSFYLYGIKNS